MKDSIFWLHAKQLLKCVPCAGYSVSGQVVLINEKVADQILVLLPHGGAEPQQRAGWKAGRK